ncbi:MAG: 50S ribosomal protein L10 [Candidatus Aenigmarchaeota archaeon]|nr:50S ribosomal protein L10 [Candidatus Aenigmarchaeota archaeon]
MVSKQKVALLGEVNNIFKSNKTVFLFDLQNLPSSQLHDIRNKLKKDEIYTLVIKKGILERSLKDSKIPLSLEELDQPALIYSNKDIFYISKALKKLKVSRKAKVSEIATEDIELPAGDTGIQAGPAISTFKQFKIQTIMKDGKIGIKDPTPVCKKGETITAELLSLINMLNIEPIEMTIQPELAYSEKIIYNSEVLKLDEQFFKDQISLSENNVFKLTVSINYPTKQNISFLLQKASQRGKTLSIELGLPAKEIMPELINKAHARASSLDASLQKSE